MSIRRLKGTPEQLSVVRQLDTQCFPADESYTGKDTHWWLVKVKDQHVGYAGLALWEHGVAFLCRVGVLKPFRGKGIQKRLIRVRERFAKKNGSKVVITYTSKTNLSSANSLISCGYKLYEPQYKYGLQDGLYWRKEI